MDALEKYLSLTSIQPDGEIYISDVESVGYGSFGVKCEPVMDEKLESKLYQPSEEQKRRIMSRLKELKRSLDKEGSTFDSVSDMQKSLFSSKPANVTILLDFLRAPNLETYSGLIIEILSKIVSKGESFAANLAFLQKRNIVPVLMDCLAKSEKSTTSNESEKNYGKGENQILLLMTMLSKLARYESSMSTIGRMHGILPIISKHSKQFWLNGEYQALIIGLKMLKIMAKNPNNFDLIRKDSEILSILCTLITSTGLLKLDSAMELFLILLKSREFALLALKTIHISVLITMVSSSVESTKIYTLKLLILILSYDFALKLFEESDGIKILTQTLNQMGTSNDLNNYKSTNSELSLLISVLELTAKHTDLPHIEMIKAGIFCLPQERIKLEEKSELLTDSDIYTAYLEGVTTLASSLKIPGSRISNGVLEKHILSNCPELPLMLPKISGTERVTEPPFNQ